MPNQLMLELRIATLFQSAAEGEVRVAPAIEVLSTWAQRTAVRLDLLAGRAVHGNAGRLRLLQAWQDAVRPDLPQASPAELRLLAAQAHAANRQLRHWLPEDEAAWLESGFRRWRREVARALERHHLFTAEDWLAHLARQLNEPGDLPLPAVIRLHGFLELTVLERQLLAALGRRGVKVEESSEPARDARDPASQRLRVFASPEQEFRGAADWARRQLEAGARRVALVVNGFEALAPQIQQVLDRELSTGGTGVAAPGSIPEVDGPYHLPSGNTLAAQPLVADALLLLRLSLQGRSRQQEFPILSRVLLSPHTAGSDREGHARAVFELELRRLGRHRLSINELRSRLRDASAAAPLADLARLLSSLPQIRRGVDIANALLDCLCAWGWPGPQATGATMQARVNAFLGQMEGLRDCTFGDRAGAVEALSQACREALVTERGGPLSPVQVLAPEQAVGETFDAAWIMNVHSDNWPGRTTGNPFLGGAALETMPRATPSGELEYTRRLQQRLLALAPALVVSYAEQSGDAPRMASPLLMSALPAVTEQDRCPGPSLLPWAGLLPAGHIAQSYRDHPWLEAIEDVRGLGLRESGSERIPGGAALLQEQSGCPLNAYLHYRLQAEFPDMPGPFADSAYRGILLHAALQRLFEPQCGRAGLPAAEQIGPAVEQALRDKRGPLRLGPAALQAERLRLTHALQEWLELERARAGFMVAAVERREEYDCQGFRLSTRIDRVDQLADGRWLIIDYKSSAPSIAGWGRERIENPQLPLYAVILSREKTDSVGGLALAAVRPGECVLMGMVDDPVAAQGALYSFENRRSGIARTFADWGALRAHWESGIDQLLQEVIAGQAPNRVYHKDALTFSGLTPVLRRAEGEAWLAAHGQQVAELEGDDDE